jgi:hypothetical protein
MAREDHINPHGNPNPSTPWDADEAIEALAMERSVDPSLTEVDLARKILLENLPAAVQGLVHIAIHGGNESLRLNAQKYIIERNMGKVGDDNIKPVETWEEFVNLTITSVEDDLKKEASRGKEGSFGE